MNSIQVNLISKIVDYKLSMLAMRSKVHSYPLGPLSPRTPVLMITTHKKCKLTFKTARPTVQLVPQRVFQGIE